MRVPKSFLRSVSALCGALLLSVAPALAQQAVLQSGSWTVGHFPVYAGTTTSPVIVDSGSAPAVINSGNVGQIPWYAATGSVLSGNANLNVSSGHLTLGQVGVIQGGLVLSGATTGLVSILPQAVAGTYNFNVPITAGTSGQPLLSGGGGSSAMSWGSLSGTTSTFATTTGAFTVGHCITTDGSGNLQDSGTGCGGSGTVNTGTAGQFSYYASSTNAVSGTSLLTLSGSTVSVSGAFTASPANLAVTLSPSGTGVVTINPATTGSMDNVAVGATTQSTVRGSTVAANSTLSAGVAGTTLGSLQLSGNTAGTVTVKTQASTGSFNFNVPTTAGSSGQPMLSGGGGSGAMTWGSLSGNTSTFATTTGSLTSGHVAAFDASGNIVDGGAPPTGTINSGTATQLAYNAGSGTTLSGNGNFTVSAGAMTVGVTGAQAGSLIISGSSTGAITLKGTGTAIGTYNWNYPTTAGSSGQPLVSGGGGASGMAWGTVTGNTTKFSTFTGSTTNGNCVAMDASGNLVDNGSPCGSGGSGTVTSSTAGQIAYYASSTNAVAGNSSLTISGGTVTLGVTSTTTGKLVFSGGTLGAVTIAPQATAGTWEFDLPTTAGSAGQVLTSQGGAGTAMTWTSPGAACCTPETTNFNCTAGNIYTVDTTGGAVTMTLPASPNNGDVCGWVDALQHFAVTNFTVGRNGKNIANIAANLLVNLTNGNFQLVWDSTNSTWQIKP